MKAILFAALVLWTLPAWSDWGSDNCAPAVLEYIKTTSVDTSKITNVEVECKMGGKESGKVVGYGFWYSFSDCPGYLVVTVYRDNRGFDLSKTCDMRHVQIYSRRGCQFEGIPYWRW